MRAPLAGLLVAMLTTAASADRQIDQAIKLYERETRVCGKNLRGINVVLVRGQAIAAKVPDLAEDLAELGKAQATVKRHCDEVASMLAFLLGASTETYKSIQKEFDERDKKIRAERVGSKQALIDIQPLVQRAVPRMNKAIATADASARPSTREKETAAKLQAETLPNKPTASVEPTPVTTAVTNTKPAIGDKPSPPVKKPFATFPSGRTVELPEPAEAWRFSGNVDQDVAEYSFAAVNGWVSVRAQAGAPSCEHVRAAATLLVRGALTRLEPSAELQLLKPAWIIGWSHGDAQVRAACIGTKTGIVVGRLETVNGNNPALDTMLARMLAGRVGRR